MRNTTSIGGKVKKTPSTLVDNDRYNFLKLADAEPNLGVPPANEGFIISDTSGNRSWVNLGAGLEIQNDEIVVNETITSISFDRTDGRISYVDETNTTTDIDLYDVINIEKRNSDVTTARLTNFLVNCFKISPETYRSGSIAKVFTKEVVISILVKSREGNIIKTTLDARWAENGVVNVSQRNGPITELIADFRSTVDITI